jgi:glycosyltransferase involved in cell wall biosynthesis
VNAALYFEPEAYLLDGPKLMGRQSAGNGFLRAAVQAQGDRPIAAVCARRETAEVFAKAVRAIDPQSRPRWIPSARLDLVAAEGVIYRPDANPAVHARERLRIGAAAYSVCGVTHTLSTIPAAEVIADLVDGPLMPWDALICTSTAGRSAVEAVMRAQLDYVAWRFGASLQCALPQLPVIPLGVHCSDFELAPGARAAARAALQIAEGEVAVLFAGRLSFNAKAHPFQMFQGLEAAARATGTRPVFLLAGQFATAFSEKAIMAAAPQVCPSVRVVHVDGKDAARFQQAWAGADVFLSLSDNYQETFGITPIEAMAAGLPVLVSDWDGYKETVRDGVDGFRVPSWAPGPTDGPGATFAADYQTSTTNFDFFSSRTSTTISVEAAPLVERLTALLTDADLRRRLGEAGARRARETFDWATVYRQYQALWRELGEIRRQRGADPALRAAAAPRATPANLDPFGMFAHYPTHRIGAGTEVRACPGAGLEAYKALTGQEMFSFWRAPDDLVTRAFAALAEGPVRLVDLAERMAAPLPATVELVARLAKMELVTLSPGREEA